MTRHSVRRPGLAAVAIIAGLLGFASGASAELRFDLKQADGGPFVLVSGDFAYSDSLEEFSRLVRENHPLFVTFDSPGGNVVKAIELGRLIRQSGLSTVEVKQLECASACAFAFFGGVERIAQPGAIGVHKASLAEPNAPTVEGAVSSIQELTANEMAYMGEMGVDPTLLQLALAYESDDIRYLSGSEMERYKVTTKQAQGQQASSEPLPTPPPSADRLARSPSADTNSLFSVPPAQSGRVRHPRGNAPLKALPDESRTAIANRRRCDLRFSREFAGATHHWSLRLDAPSSPSRRLL